MTAYICREAQLLAERADRRLTNRLCMAFGEFS